MEQVRAPVLGGRTGALLRFGSIVVTVTLLLAAVVEAAIVLPAALGNLHVTWGMDLRLYLEHTARWLAGDGFYLPEQAAPYDIDALKGAVYPPVIVLLLLPFLAGLPWLLWWLVPFGIIGASIAAARPAWWQWPLLALILAYPRTWVIIVLGNPAMWALAALAAGMVWKWPAVGVLLKLTYAPFALVGIRDRRWWAALALGLLLAVPFGAMWFDFVDAVRFAHSARGLDYTIGEWPVAILLVVSLARVRAGYDSAP